MQRKLRAGGKESKFASEAQLEENKAKHGERLEDGTFSGRTLTEAIVANREEKDAKFKETWKQMKQGAPPLSFARPLDDRADSCTMTERTHAR